MKSISAEQLKQYERKGAVVRSEPKPGRQEPKEQSSQVATLAAKSAERAENAAILVADIARSMSEMTMKQLAQIEKIVSDVNAGNEPVPWSVEIDRDPKGFAKTLRVIPDN